MSSVNCSLTSLNLPSACLFSSADRNWHSYRWLRILLPLSSSKSFLHLYSTSVTLVTASWVHLELLRLDWFLTSILTFWSQVDKWFDSRNVTGFFLATKGILFTRVEILFVLVDILYREFHLRYLEFLLGQKESRSE